MKHSLQIIDIESIRRWGKPLPRKCLIERDEEILRLCKNRNVLHLGAAGAPFHKERAYNGSLLHQKVSTVASSLLGIDQDTDAIDYLRSEHNINNIVVGDACQVKIENPYDVVLCCDIIEHVRNPGLLLDSCRRCITSEGCLVVTTVNATSLKLALRALQGREAVHYDHVSWYSFATLCVLLLQCGFTPLTAGFFCYPTVTAFSRLFFGFCSRLRPGSADGLLITAKPK